jgi:hypothetical protein
METHFKSRQSGIALIATDVVEVKLLRHSRVWATAVIGLLAGFIPAFF